MHLILVRHPPVRLPPGLCYGRLDPPLSPAGLADVPALAARLAAHRPARVWSSPAARCLVLARAVSSMAGAPLVVDARLRELDFGAWEGLAWDCVPREALDRWASDPLGFAPPGGEPGHALLARAGAIVAALRAAAEDAVVVTHGGPLRLLPALLAGRAPDLLSPAPPMGAVLCVHA